MAGAKNARSVQQEMQDALEKVLDFVPPFQDAATRQRCARKSIAATSTVKSPNTEKILGGLNHFLPLDIGALALENVAEDFHARYSCTGKEYKYVIYNSYRRDPFGGQKLWGILIFLMKS